MIDIHCHILPQLDDGPASIEEAIEMARAAVANGIDTVVATPHHANGIYYNEASDIHAAVQELNRELCKFNIDLKVLPGQENRFNRGFINDLVNGKLLMLNNSRYLLAELPLTSLDYWLDGVVHELRILGIIPVIAHPERHKQVIENSELLQRFTQLGALNQISASSITGALGRRIQKTAFTLCEQQLVHFVASDAHDAFVRPFQLQQAHRIITGRFGIEYSNVLRRNAQLLIEDQNVEYRQSAKTKRPFFLLKQFIYKL